MVGLSDLEGLFWPKLFCDSMTQWFCDFMTLQSLLALCQPWEAEPFPKLRFVDFLPLRQQDCIWKPGSFMQSKGGFPWEVSFPEKLLQFWSLTSSQWGKDISEMRMLNSHCFNTGFCPRALLGVSGKGYVVCSINHLWKASPLWEERKMCSVHVLTSFSLFAKEVTFCPEDGCGVLPGLSFSHDCLFRGQNACSLHPGLGVRGSSPHTGAGMGRVRCFCDVSCSLQGPSLLPGIPQPFPLLFCFQCIGLGVRSRMWHFKNPWHCHELSLSFAHAFISFSGEQPFWALSFLTLCCL